MREIQHLLGAPPPSPVHGVRELGGRGVGREWAEKKVSNGARGGREEQMKGSVEGEGGEQVDEWARRGAQPLQGRRLETGASRAPSELCWGPALRCILGSIALPRAPSSAVIYGWARPGDLGRITNDGSITLQKK